MNVHDERPVPGGASEAAPRSRPGGPTWLFCPADRPDRFEKALAIADVVILDLEDAVLPEAKSRARNHILESASSLDPGRTIVRINPIDSAWGEADLEVLHATHFETVMLPKAASPSQVAELGRFSVAALCETAAGVIAAPEIATSPACIALAWGGEDLAVDLASSPRGRQGKLHPTGSWARLAVRYAAAAAGVAAVDTVWTDIADLDGLESDARAAASCGFDAKLAIHPSQVPVIRRAFQPADADVRRAHRILAAAEEARTRGLGAVQLDGAMIDAPVIARAARLIARAERVPASSQDQASDDQRE